MGLGYKSWALFLLSAMVFITAALLVWFMVAELLDWWAIRRRIKIARLEKLLRDAQTALRDLTASCAMADEAVQSVEKAGGLHADVLFAIQRDRRAHNYGSLDNAVFWIVPSSPPIRQTLGKWGAAGIVVVLPWIVLSMAWTTFSVCVVLLNLAAAALVSDVKKLALWLKGVGTL